MSSLSNPKTSAAVADAVTALRAEERELEARLKAVRAALTPLLWLAGEGADQVRTVSAPRTRSFLSTTALQRLAEAAKDRNAHKHVIDELQEESSNGDSSNPFSGLLFSQALHKHMMAESPSQPPMIARSFEEAGWKFTSDQQNHKVNQVGVTLRRFKGKLFEQNDDGLWFAIDDL